jgi:hypothetical protein
MQLLKWFKILITKIEFGLIIKRGRHCFPLFFSIGFKKYLEYPIGNAIQFEVLPLRYQRQLNNFVLLLLNHQRQLNLSNTLLIMYHRQFYTPNILLMLYQRQYCPPTTSHFIYSTRYYISFLVL